MKRVPDFELGAPSTYAPPVNFISNIANLDKWDIWWEPLLRENWYDFDFVDFHAYGFDPRQILANLDVLAAYGDVHYQERKPVAMTEVGYAEAVIHQSFSIQEEPNCWRLRSLPYARYLISMAAEPDRIWAALYYDLSNHEFGMFRKEGFEPTSVVDVFLAMAPVRGELLGSDSKDPELIWMASRQEGELYLAIATGERNGSPIQLRLPAGFAGTAEVKQVALNANQTDVEKTEFTVLLEAGEVELPPMPGSLVIVRYQLPSALRAYTVVERQEYFADEVVGLIDTQSPSLVWKLEGLPDPMPSSRYTLRMSSFGPAALEDIEFRLNGHEVKIDGKYRSEVPLPSEWIEPSNTFEARLKAPAGLSFVLGAVSILESTPHGIDRK
jgi:hypothetical protein